MSIFNRCLLLLVLLLLPQHGWADETAYLSQERVDLTALLSPPPAVGSQQQQQEIALLLKLQRERTPDQVAFAQADTERTVFRFQDVFGADFTAEKLPLLAVLFTKVQHNADHLLKPAKKHWNRPRPFVSDLDIHPCVERPDSASYPSAHSTFGTLAAILLAEMVPEKRTQLHDRAELYRLNREIGGAHYPSDVLAGRISGTVIAAFLLNDSAFLAEFSKAKSELRKVLKLPLK
jgi:acid phosphatase (class A)